ncbi:DUF6289 family protein [Nonomuraea sp. NEAU-A123]|uniref:DUF6289 family protein n=1 Tax=Nonomuraea sp. NEAU-A123 TaxID=2839649 RepID=UPI001BE413E6|nr:DUF6289 family protein [Nonomuraea sp. NEAU-A123]MBT2229279.1 hypothetical protein [Nonomuraea sp. NEAU-A123]
MTNPRRFRGVFFAVTCALATLLAAVLAAALVLLPAGTASATAPVAEPTVNISVPPSGGDVLLVFDYFDENDKLIGQFWRGCNQPSGGWGVRQGRLVIFTPPCGP